MNLIFIVFSRDFLVFISKVRGEISFFFLLNWQLMVVYFNNGGFWLIRLYYQLLLFLSRTVFNPWSVDWGRGGLLGDNTGNEFGRANSASALCVHPVGSNFKAFGNFFFFFSCSIALKKQFDTFFFLVVFYSIFYKKCCFLFELSLNLGAITSVLNSGNHYEVWVVL